MFRNLRTLRKCLELKSINTIYAISRGASSAFEKRNSSENPKVLSGHYEMSNSCIDLSDSSKLRFTKKMSTFSVDNLLPSLPVPCLDKTLDKYLESVKPFVNEQELKNTERVVDEFRNGLGQTLQTLLKEKAKHERNWLEKWWLDYAYLEWREPIAPFINTNGYFVGTSENDFQYVPKNFKLDVRLAYASMQCHYYTQFHDILRNETLPIQKSRANYFSMDQWYNLFNTCRIPCVGKDRLDVHFRTAAESSECPSHIVVMYKYRFYKLETRHNNELLNITEFYKQLEKIVTNSKNQSFGIGIGALTADRRDDWARNRQHLIDLHNFNKKSLELIETSLYLLVLDESIPLNNSELAKVGLCGDPKNRFFDKSVQSICAKNGRFMANIDHTPFDGMVSKSLMDYAIDRKKKDNYDISKTDSFEVRPNLEDPKEICFIHDSKIENEINKSVAFFNKNAQELVCDELKITDCNKEMIKSFKTNPDTFVQMCMQLAYYQLHKKPAPTYESATTRGYYHGRTETLRSCTSEAVKWCQAMVNYDKETRLSDAELLKLFREACAKHDKLMSECRDNSGVDRHLTGLRLLVRDLDLKVPEIFTDATWKKSGGDGNYVISSSLAGFSNSTGTCAAMCQNGYALFYCFPDTGITFSLGRYRSSQETCLVKIASSLESAVEQTKSLFKVKSRI